MPTQIQLTPLLLRRVQGDAPDRLQPMNRGRLISVVLLAWLGCVASSVRIRDVGSSLAQVATGNRSIASHALQMGSMLPQEALVIAVFPKEYRQIHDVISRVAGRYLSPRQIHILYGELPVDPEEVNPPEAWRDRPAFAVVPTEMGERIKSARVTEHATHGRVTAFRLQWN